MPDGEILTGEYQLTENAAIGVGFAGSPIASGMEAGAPVVITATGPKTIMNCEGSADIGGNGSGVCETNYGAHFLHLTRDSRFRFLVSDTVVMWICIQSCCGAERVGERHRHWRCGDRSHHEVRRVGGMHQSSTRPVGSGFALRAEFRGSDNSEMRTGRPEAGVVHLTPRALAL